MTWAVYLLEEQHLLTLLVPLQCADEVGSAQIGWRKLNQLPPMDGKLFVGGLLLIFLFLYVGVYLLTRGLTPPL